MSVGTFKQVTVTAPDEATATQLADWAVDGRHAACAQISGPITSVYRWQGERHRESEWVVTFKTTAAGATRLSEQIPARHPYDVPEILSVDVTGEHRYLAWLEVEVAG